MKKLTVCIVTAFLLLASIPMQVNAMAVTNPSSMTAPKTAESAEANALHARLNEIKAIDKSNLRPSEKKQLRKETRSIKSQLRAVSGGVYISAGAVIIILLLVLILL